MILLAEAERAKDIANVLEKFRDYDPDRAIDSTINKIRDLTPVLRELAANIERQDGVVSRGFADDLELLQHSVAYTLQDIWTILGRMPSHHISHDYRDAWKQIQLHSRATRTQSLAMRIETYCLFAAALRRHLRGYILSYTRASPTNIELVTLPAGAHASKIFARTSNISEGHS